MSQLSRVYLHLPSFGDTEACVEARAALRPVFKEMYARREILGYRLFMLNDREAAEEELLHHMFDYVTVTQGRFPFVYASVTPSDRSEQSIDELMRQRGFQRFR